MQKAKHSALHREGTSQEKPTWKTGELLIHDRNISYTFVIALVT